MGRFLERVGVRLLFSIPLRDGKCMPVYLHTFLLFFSFLYHFSACIWRFFCTFAQVKFECAVCAHNHIFCCWMNILVGVDVIELLW